MTEMTAGGAQLRPAATANQEPSLLKRLGRRRARTQDPPDPQDVTTRLPEITDE